MVFMQVVINAVFFCVTPPMCTSNIPRAYIPRYLEMYCMYIYFLHEFLLYLFLFNPLDFTFTEMCAVAVFSHISRKCCMKISVIPRYYSGIKDSRMSYFSTPPPPQPPSPRFFFAKYIHGQYIISSTRLGIIIALEFRPRSI